MRFILACLFLVSCGKNSSSPTAAVSAKIGTVDIVDAANLFVTTSTAAGLNLGVGEALKPSTLYKTTDAGVVQEVTYTNDDGSTMTEVKVPTAILRPSADVVVLDFGESQYLVNKGTGKAYETTDGSSLKGLIGDNAALTLASATSKLFGIKGGSLSTKGEMVGVEFVGDDLQLTQLSANGDNVNAFWKDKLGNFVYSTETGLKKRGIDGKFAAAANVSCVSTSLDGTILGYVKNSDSGDLTSVVNSITGAVVKDLSNSSKYLLTTTSATSMTSLKVYNKDQSVLYCLTSTAEAGCDAISDSTPAGIVTALNASSKVVASYDASNKVMTIDSATPLHSVSPSAGWTSVLYHSNMCGTASTTKLGTKLISKSGSTVKSLEVFDDSDFSVTVIPIANEFDTYKTIRANDYDLQTSAKYVYGMANGKIQRVDLTAKTVTPIEIADLLEVKFFAVAQDDSITLNGTLTNGSSFVGSYVGGKLTVTSNTSAGAISIIKPLN